MVNWGGGGVGERPPFLKNCYSLNHHVPLVNVSLSCAPGLNNLLAAYPDKSAYAQCTIAYSPGGGAENKIMLFTGKTHVRMSSEAGVPVSSLGRSK